MKFTRENTSSLLIRSVSGSTIRIADEIYDRTIALTVNGAVEEWNGKAIGELRQEDFEAILDAKPEIIVLGTGERIEFAHRELVFSMARAGVGLEVMDTKAAARTFNVLAADGRRVAAVLYV